MSDHPSLPVGRIAFRGLANRTLADQERALSMGYTDMRVYAIDELANMVHELSQRVDRLEADMQNLERLQP